MTSDVRVHFLSYLDRLSRCAPSFLNAGCYQLFLRLPDARIVKVGALGQREFQSGIYIYSGSGRKNLFQRVERHLSVTKKKFWHIDYLTSGTDFLFLHILLYFSEQPECFFHQQLCTYLNAQIPVPGLGSTDCKNGCDSHLLYLKSGEHLVLSDWQKFLQGNYRQLKFIQLSYRK